MGKNLMSEFSKNKGNLLFCGRLIARCIAMEMVPSSTTSIKIHSFLVNLTTC